MQASKGGDMGQSNVGNAKDRWEMRWDQLRMSAEKLGEGVFGQVHKATLTTNPNFLSNGVAPKQLDKIRENRHVAVKMLREHASAKSKENFLGEIEIMKSLGNGHRFVVNMLGCVTKPPVEITLGLVLEFCAAGNLLNYLRKLKENEEEVEKLEKYCGRQFSQWAWQIADGMHFLASKNLVHRDLAARNVLLDEEMVAKISDCGLCIRLDSSYKTSGESKQNTTVESDEEQQIVRKEEKQPMVNEKLPIRWLAPESLEHGEFSKKSDVWSYGILLHEIYTFGTNPFEGIDPKALLEHIQHFKLPKMEMCQEKMFECMQECLNLEASLRPGFVKIQIKLAALLEEKAGEYGYLMLN